MEKSSFVGCALLLASVTVSAFSSDYQQTTTTKDGCSHFRVTAPDEDGKYLTMCPPSGGWSSSVEDIPSQTHLLLFTRFNHDIAQEMKVNDVGSVGRFAGSKPTKIIVHGFSGSASTPWMIDMKDAFLNKEDVNVILVDWSDLSKAPYYNAAVKNTKLVGNYVATLIDWLNQTAGSSSDRYHLIGFSLGAHVVGFVGKAVTTGKLARITGLDPAYPLYENADKSGRLDVGDAEFVDVIHSNSGSLYEGGLSFLQPLGHVDFFPNGGQRQPECKSLLESIIDIFKDGFSIACSHNRTPQLFLESIENPQAFPAYLCADYDSYTRGKCTRCVQDPSGFQGECIRMGLSATKPSVTAAYTILYLSTRASRPFHGRPFFFRLSTSAQQKAGTRGWVHLNLTSSSSSSFEAQLSDCPLLFNEEMRFETGVDMFAARNVLLEMKDVQTGFLNFTEYGGSDQLALTSIRVFDEWNKTSVCDDGPLVVAVSDQLVSMNFTNC